MYEKDPKIEEKQTRRCYALPGEMKCPIQVTLSFSDQHFPLHFWAIVGGRQIVECLGRCLMYTLSLAPFSPRNPAICQIWRKSLGFFLNLCFDDFDWNFEDSNPILRWDDPILVLIIFTGSFAGWPLSEHHINWRKLKTKRHGRARSWWWKILSAVRHDLYLLQTKILFALRRQIPHFAKDKQTSTARNVTA